MISFPYLKVDSLYYFSLIQLQRLK